MRPTLPNPPPPRQLPSAHTAPNTQMRDTGLIVVFLLSVLGVLVEGFQRLEGALAPFHETATAMTAPRDGTERTCPQAAQLDDGRIYITEATFPNHQVAYHHWLFDPASLVATPIEVGASFKDCLPIGLQGHTVIGFHPRTDPHRHCALDLDQGSITWLSAPYRQRVTGFPKPAEHRKTDVDLEALVRPWLPNATLFAAQPLRTNDGTPIEVEGRTLVALHLGRTTARARLGERYLIALPRADGSGPVWQIEGKIRGHSTLAFDGVFRVGPHEVLLLIGAQARIIDVRTGEVVRSTVFPSPPP